MMRHAQRQRPAFSLLELLVAMVVVAILATTIFSVINRSILSANSSAAASNLRQLATAQFAYANEHGHRLPTFFSQDQVSWQIKIMPYLGLEHIDHDGWVTMRMDPESILNVPDSLPADQREFGSVSIAMNYMLEVPDGLLLSTVARPDSLLLLAECTEYNSDALYPSDVPAPASPAYRRDNGTKALAVFCDGHVEALPKEDFGFKYFVRDSIWWEWEI